DDPWIQWIIADELADRGNEVMTASDGIEALECLRQTRPDVIVLDLVLPRLDGWEFANRYRQVTDGTVIPMVVVSAARQAHFPALSSGVATFLRKPLDIEQLASSVAQLGEARQTLADAQANV